MKKFFINFALFIIPLIVGFVLLEYGLQKVPNSYNQRKKAFEKHMREVEVINLGTSNAVNGIDPAQFSVKAYNMANVTQTIYYDEQLLKYYLDSMPKLKMVIIPITYVTLHRRMQDLEEKWRMDLYHYYWKIKIEDEPRFHISKYSLLPIYTPHVVMGIIRRKFKVDMAPRLSPLGYEARDTAGQSVRMIDRIGKGRVLYHSNGYNPKNVAEGTATLERIIKMLQARNIVPVLIKTPVHRSYSDNAKPEILATITRVTGELEKKYGIKMYDYFSDPRFTVMDFADSDHLSKYGAEKFSKIIDSEIIRPVLAK